MDAELFTVYIRMIFILVLYMISVIFKHKMQYENVESSLAIDCWIVYILYCKMIKVYDNKCDDTL